MRIGVVARRGPIEEQPDRAVGQSDLLITLNINCGEAREPDLTFHHGVAILQTGQPGAWTWS
jgi:hypothetical protein